MDISIITPFYKGNEYMNDYFKNVTNAINNSKYSVEIIIVNDSPEINVEYGKNLTKNININIITNPKNCGIQQSRVNGINVAKGKYILFLDQDDFITKNSINSQLEKIEKDNADVVVGNGFIEESKTNARTIIYNSIFAKMTINKNVYLKSRNFIISPGMCLIKKESIPEEWKKNILKINCADDYFLWLLMFNNNCKFVFNYDYVYVHRYTGNNVSDDFENTHLSQLEMLSYLKDELNKKDYEKLKKTIEFKYDYKSGNKKIIIKYPFLFLYNTMCSLICNRIKTFNEKDYSQYM